MKDFLAKYLEDRNFFKIREEINNELKGLPEKERLLYKMYYEQAFNNVIKSNEYADLLLNDHKIHIDRKTTAKILCIKSNNYFQSFRYKEASEICNILLTQYNDELSEAEIEEYTNYYALYRTLSQTEAQKIIKNCDIKIESYRNKFNHVIVPVKCGGFNDEFVFDTGANISTISQSCAKKMNVRIYESNISVGNANDGMVQMKLGVTDLFIGNIVCKNVIFLISPDEDLTFPQINYEIHGVIGFPVIQQLGEIHIHKNGKLFIPYTYTKKNNKNIFFNQLEPVVQVFSDNEMLMFFLDTGADVSSLHKKYYDNHREKIEKTGVLRSGRQGGAGGFVDIKFYEIDNFSCQIGSVKNTFNKISVFFEEIKIKKYYDGVIGQDLLLQYEKMILNFREMYIDFE